MYAAICSGVSCARRRGRISARHPRDAEFAPATHARLVSRRRLAPRLHHRLRCEAQAELLLLTHPTAAVVAVAIAAAAVADDLPNLIKTATPR